MSFIVVGTNYKYSPIEVREKLSFSKKRLRDALFLLKERGTLNGGVILSTCNRVEIYATTEETITGESEIKDFISKYHEICKQEFLPYLYIYEGREAIRHLFQVACGLDSLVLGETQILGQVKYAASQAEDAHFADDFSKQIFDSAISFAKNIHQETKISEGKVSIGSIAMDFIKERLGSLSDKNILIIGVGKVTELVLKYLEKENINVVFVANGTFEKAKKLANRIKGIAVRFDELKPYLKKADVVITATASPHFIIKKETIEGTIDKKLLILDLAIPRDVDPIVRQTENIELFDLEEMGSVAQKNIKKRRVEAEKVKEIIGIEVEERWGELIESEQEPVLLRSNR